MDFIRGDIGQIYVTNPDFSSNGSVLSAVFVLLQFFPRNVFFKLASFQESCYHFFIRPEDRARLSSNPSAAAGG